MAEQSGNQRLKEYMKKFVNDGGLTDILRAEIKAILQTEVKNILNQAPDTKDEIILLTGNPNDKGASDIPGRELNKGKGVLSTPEDTEDDCEFYQEELPQSSFGVASTDESESIMKNQELAYRITQLEVLMKENTDIMTRGLNQLFMLMNELLQEHSKQPFHPQLDEAESPKVGYQNMVGYPEFPELPTVNLRSTHRKYAKFNQPLSKIFKKLQQKNLLQPREPKPLPNPLPPQINQNLFCHFHQLPGHTTDNCKTLKNVIQDLIDSEKIDDPERQPNVKTNPLPKYQDIPHTKYKSPLNYPTTS